MTVKLPRSVILLITASLFTISVSADEQAAEQKVSGDSVTKEKSIKEENWYGTLERFNKHPITIKYKIKERETGVTNAELIINKETFSLEDFTRGELDNKVGKFVRFRFKPGGNEEVECLLTLSDSKTNAYSGLCPPNAAFDTTGVRRLTMHRASGEREPEEPASNDASNP